MPGYYLDTSALVKGYAQETGTAWISALIDPQAGNQIYTSRLAGPEMVAAFARKARTGEVTPAEATRITAVYRYDWQSDNFTIIEVTGPLADRAMDLAARHGLRGYDAVHLATASEVHNIRLAVGESALIFVSADNNLDQAAVVEGLPVDNPNMHP
jgi:predicted nucleic acid-binding protein